MNRFQIRCNICKETFSELREYELHHEDKHEGLEQSFEVLELKEAPKGFVKYEYEQYPHLWYNPQAPEVFDELRGELYKYPQDVEKLVSHPYGLAVLQLLKYLAMKETRTATEETLKEKSKLEALREMINLMLTPPKREELIGYFDIQLEKLRDFLLGSDAYCGLCQTMVTDVNQMLFKQLWKDRFNLKEGVMRYVIELTIDGTKKKVPLWRVIHVLDKHRSLVKLATDLGVIKGLKLVLKELEKEQEVLEKAEKNLHAWVKDVKVTKTEMTQTEIPEPENGVKLLHEWLKKRPQYK